MTEHLLWCLVFACLFCSRHLMQIGKMHAKSEHRKKRFALLVLAGLLHPLQLHWSFNSVIFLIFESPWAFFFERAWYVNPIFQEFCSLKPQKCISFLFIGYCTKPAITLVVWPCWCSGAAHVHAVMAIRVLEFSNGGFKIRKIFA